MAASAVRLASFLAAFSLGAFFYRAQLANQPILYWFAGWITACALLALAFADRRESPETRARRGLRWLSGAAAVAAFALFYHLAPQHGSELGAGVAAIASFVLFLLARWVPFDTPSIQQLLGGDPTRRPSRISRPLLRAAVGAGAVAAGVAVIPLNKSDHLAAFLLWLGSLALLVAATWERGSRAPPEGPWTHQGGPPVSPRTQWMALLLILALAAALRIVFLDAYPHGIDPDEGRMGKHALSIWEGGFPDAFNVGWNNFPDLSYMVQTFWVMILGKGLAHLRLSGAMVGVISILPLFFWVRRWWGNVVALLAAFLLAINQQAIHWSRTGLNNVHQLFVAACILATFARALQRNRPLDWVWFGFAAGLGFHTYHACKIYPLLIAAVSLVLVVGIPGLLRRSFGGALVGGLAFVLMTAPNFATSYEKWERVRHENLSRFDVHTLVEAHERDDTAAVRNYLRAHVGLSLAIFTSLGPVSYVDPLTAVPFLLGIGWMFWRWRDPRHLTCLVFMFGILCLGAMITIYPPSEARTVGMLPAICAVPAVVLGRLRPIVRDVVGNRRFDFVLAPLLVIAMSATTYVNSHNQFIKWPEIHSGRLSTVLCREIVAFKGPGVVYMVGGLTYPPGVALLDCFAAERPDLRIVDLPNDTAFAPLPPEHQGNALILVPYSHESLLPLVEHHFGEANHEVVAGKFGQPALHLFELTRDQSSAQRGLLGVVERGNAAPELTARHGPPFVTPPAPPWLRTEWRGSIHVPVADSYELKTNAHELRLDRTLVPPHGRIYLAAGWHEISLETRPTGEDTPVTLAWRRGDSEWQNIEPAILAPSAPTGGLLRRHFSEVLQLSDAQPSGQRPDYTGVEPGVSVEQNHIWSPEKNLHLRVVPSTTEWIGKIAIDSDVPREIKLIGTSPAQLYLDDRLVLDLPRGKREAQTVWRGAGSFSFLLRTVRLLEDSPDYVMRLLWREPGERWTSVPSYRLPDSLPALSRTLEPKDTVTKGP